MTLIDTPDQESQVTYAFLMIKVSENPDVPPLLWGTLRWDGSAPYQGWNPLVASVGLREHRKAVQHAVQMLMMAISATLKPGAVLGDVIQRTVKEPLLWRTRNVDAREDALLQGRLAAKTGGPQ